MRAFFETHHEATPQGSPTASSSSFTARTSEKTSRRKASNWNAGYKKPRSLGNPSSQERPRCCTTPAVIPVDGGSFIGTYQCGDHGDWHKLVLPVGVRYDLTIEHVGGSQDTDMIAVKYDPDGTLTGSGSFTSSDQFPLIDDYIAADVESTQHIRVYGHPRHRPNGISDRFLLSDGCPVAYRMVFTKVS